MRRSQRRTYERHNIQVLESFTMAGGAGPPFSQFTKFAQMTPYDFVIGAAVRSGGVVGALSGTTLMASNDDGFMSVAVYGRYIGSALSTDTFGAGTAFDEARFYCLRGVQDGSRVYGWQCNYVFNTVPVYSNGTHCCEDGVLFIGQTQRGGNNGKATLSITPPINAIDTDPNGNVSLRHIQMGVYQPCGPIANYGSTYTFTGGSAADSDAFSFSVR